MNYPLELKRHLAKTMAKVDHDCMGTDFDKAYEFHLASESFELLAYWMEYFGVFEGGEELLVWLSPENIKSSSHENIHH